MRHKLLVLLAALMLIGTAFILNSVASTSTYSWTGLGPEGSSIHSVAVSPDFALDNTLFAAAWNGVYKSSDGGKNWNHVYQITARRSSFVVAASPKYKTDKTVFATTWGWGGGSVIKSVDNGATWSAIASTGFQVFAISPNYNSAEGTSTLFAAVSTIFTDKTDMVYRSTDGGKTWTAISIHAPDVLVQSIAISPNYATDNTVFAGTSAGVFKSTNGGDTWSRPSSTTININDKFVGPVAVSPNYAIDRTVFAGTEVATETAAIYRSTDWGRNWTKMSTGIISDNISSIAISPGYSTDRTIFAATFGQGVYKSTDGGQNWIQINSGLTNTEIYDGALAVAPNYTQSGLVFAGTYGAGLFSYTEQDTPPSSTTTSEQPSTTTEPPTTSTTTEPPSTTTTTLPPTTTTTNGGSTTTTNGGADTQAPSKPTGLKIVSVGGSFSLEWTASTDNVGVTGYKIERSTSSTGSFSRIGTSTENAYIDATVLSGKKYYYRVLADDQAGNTSGYSSVVSRVNSTLRTATAQQTSSYINWSGTWTNFTSSYYLGGSTKYSKVAGSSLEFTFKGTSVALIGAKRPNRGIAKVYIDGQYETTVDQYASSTSYRQTIFNKKGLVDTMHTMKIEVTGEKRTAATDAIVEVDAVKITSVAPGFCCEQNDALAVYAGTDWTDLASSYCSDGSMKYSRTANDSVEFSFKGTAVYWVGAKQSARGIAKVYIDGRYVTTINQYLSSASYQQAIYYKTGLSNTTHKIKIVATGTKSTSSTDPITDIDCFIVY